jgi:hypothetical protein
LALSVIRFGFPVGVSRRSPVAQFLVVRLLGHFMTITQVAILLMRLFGVYLFFDVMLVLTELPTEIFAIQKSQIDYITTEHEFVLAMSLVRLFIYAGAGICFLFFARPLAKLFTKDL